MKKLPYILLFVLLSNFVFTQTIRSKNWPSAMDKELKGNIKSWTMLSGDKTIRTLKYDKDKNLISDSYKGTKQTYLHPEALLLKMKADCEKSYPKADSKPDKFTKQKFNKRNQLLSKKIHRPEKGVNIVFNDRTVSYSIINSFDENGNILSSETAQKQIQTRAWNSIHHEEPTYTYSVSMGSLILFEYNTNGDIAEIQYYDSDIFKSVRMIYIYDENFNLLESLRYDSYNIRSAAYGEDYINKILKANHNADFNINDIYPEFWTQGSPSKQTWAYNDLNQKIEHITYGYKKGPSFKATWEYDDNGLLIKEIQYDVYHDTISAIILFDKKGNVIKETNFGYWEKKEYHFEYLIEYY